MTKTRKSGKELFNRHFSQIESIVYKIATRKRLGLAERQELYSRVMMKVIQDDYAVLRDFKGQSRWSTYLTVVIQRVLLDHRVKEWGRWRPCAFARRAGTTAVLLDRLINRDDFEPAEAVRLISMQGSNETASELERLMARIPRRPRRHLLSDDEHLQALSTLDRADQALWSADREHVAASLRTALVSALRDLTRQDRYLLKQRFFSGWTVRRIAAEQSLEARPLYRRFERILRQLRRRLEQIGLGWQDVAEILDSSESDLNLDLM